jgi:hypothetical protein
MRDDRLNISPAPTAATPDHKVQARSPAPLAAPLSGADWSQDGLDDLGRTMARRDIDLGTAIRVFFEGEPERFNYMPKRDVPVEFRATVRLLDNICQRINSGFYLPHPGQCLPCRAALETWLSYQRSDASEKRKGRWTFDERVLVPLLDPSWCSAPENLRRRATTASFWHAVLAPIRGLGIDRDILKYKNQGSDKP